MPLSPPPRKADGAVAPHDHSEILDVDGVIRRVSEQQVVFDAKLGGKRLSTKAFKPSSGPDDGLSVDLQRLIEEAGLDAREYVTSPRWIGSIRFVAGELRAEGFRVGFDPITGSGEYVNPFHGEVWGAFTRAQITRLSRICEWFVELDDVALHE